MRIGGLPRKWKDISVELSASEQVSFLSESFTLYRSSPLRLLAWWMVAVVLGAVFFGSWAGKIWLLLWGGHLVYVLVRYVVLFDEFRRKWK